MTELDALLILNAVPGLGNVRIRTLLERYGSAREVLSLKENDFAQDSGIPPDVIQNILRFSKDEFFEKEQKLLAQKQVHVITFQDDHYPPQLQQIADAPVLLYMQGDIPADMSLSIAIVGSRRASIYGLSIAEQFATRLAELGFTIVSGMARGIDTAAHQGALKAHGATIAVLGCGLSHIYPPENKGLVEKIITAGAIVSEFPMQIPPLPHNFPRRNRIISGLSLGVVIAEAAEKSGALITADCALEQGREVFAIPGKVDSPTARGVNNLIKQGAKLVTCIEDILDELKPQLLAKLKRRDFSAVEEEQKVDGEILTEQERSIYNHITDRPVHIDELTNSCSLTTPLTIAVLMQLELKRLIKQLPGKWFVR